MYFPHIEYDDYTDDTDWSATFTRNVMFYYGGAFDGNWYTSTQIPPAGGSTDFYGTVCTRFIPVWQNGYSIGDTVTLLTGFGILTQTYVANEITIAGATTVLASAAAALALASAL